MAEVCQQVMCLCLTSEACSVRGIHGYHGLRDAGWMADSGLVHGTHPKHVRPPLHQSCDREASVLDWDFITPSPVMGAHLTPGNI